MAPGASGSIPAPRTTRLPCPITSKPASLSTRKRSRTRGDTMPALPQHLPVRLTQAQRKVVAEIAPGLAERLKLDERNQRTIPFSLAELKAIQEKAGKALRQASTGTVRNSLRHVTDLATQALERSQGIGAI